ncbi:MAG: helix-turn-helix domain-containing protein [Bryobacterales bacterium]|nr:helix-turn-helix domain-containing protein [Bryobacterales bacterium]
MSTSHTPLEPTPRQGSDNQNLSELLHGLPPEIHHHASATLAAELFHFGLKRQLLAMERQAGLSETDFLLRVEMLLASVVERVLVVAGRAYYERGHGNAAEAIAALASTKRALGLHLFQQHHPEACGDRTPRSWQRFWCSLRNLEEHPVWAEVVSALAAKDVDREPTEYFLEEMERLQHLRADPDARVAAIEAEGQARHEQAGASGQRTTAESAQTPPASQERPARERYWLLPADANEVLENARRNFHHEVGAVELALSTAPAAILRIQAAFSVARAGGENGWNPTGAPVSELVAGEVSAVLQAVYEAAHRELTEAAGPEITVEYGFSGLALWVFQFLHALPQSVRVMAELKAAQYWFLAHDANGQFHVAEAAPGEPDYGKRAAAELQRLAYRFQARALELVAEEGFGRAAADPVGRIDAPAESSASDASGQVVVQPEARAGVDVDIPLEQREAAIRQAREALALESDEVLAEKLGVSPTTLSRWKTGRVGKGKSMVSEETARTVAKKVRKHLNGSSLPTEFYKV